MSNFFFDTLWKKKRNFFRKKNQTFLLNFIREQNILHCFFGLVKLYRERERDKGVHKKRHKGV